MDLTVKAKTKILTNYTKTIGANHDKVVALLNSFEYPTRKDISVKDLDKKVRTTIKKDAAFNKALTELIFPALKTMPVKQASYSGPIKKVYYEAGNTLRLNSADGTVDNTNLAIDPSAQVIMAPQVDSLPAPTTSTVTDQAAAAVKDTLMSQSTDDKTVTAAIAQSSFEKAEGKWTDFHKKYPVVSLVVAIGVIIGIVYVLNKYVLKKLNLA